MSAVHATLELLATCRVCQQFYWVDWEPEKYCHADEDWELSEVAVEWS